MTAAAPSGRDAASKWLLLTYKIPREPTAKRVYVWRKLKQLGAAPLQDAVWLLPATEKNREQLQWIASEIMESGGEASLFESTLLMAGDVQFHALFASRVRKTYREILQSLRARRPDLAELSKKYQRAKALDFFDSPLGRRVRAKLLSAQEAKL